MKVQLVGSSVGQGIPHQFAMSYVINGTLAIDAGCIGQITPLDDQRRIANVFLSHSHMDHIASLAQFLDNVYQPGTDCPTIHASQHVMDCLQRDLFNDRLWPDLVRISREETPFFEKVILVNEQPVEVEGGLTITPVELNHVVPTFGFVIDDGDAAVAIICDTGPTTRVWKLANNTPNLKAVFLDASFPDHMGWLAEKARHLTPTMLKKEAEKLTIETRVFAVHIKPAFHDEIVHELSQLGMASY